MRICFLILLFPFLSAAQTAHVDDDEVKYKGTIKVEGASAADLYTRVQQVLKTKLDEHQKIKEMKDEGSNSILVRAESKLPTPYIIKRKVHYSIHLTATDGGIKYKIDSVSVSEKKRGEELQVKSSEKILQDLDAAGAIRSATLAILNQVDMKFQQLIAILKSELTSSRGN